MSNASINLNVSIETLVLWARSSFDGLASKDGRGFWSIGVLEYWSVGKRETQIQLEFVLALLHYSRILPHEKETIETPSGGGSKPGPEDPDVYFGMTTSFLVDRTAWVDKLGSPEKMSF